MVIRCDRSEFEDCWLFLGKIVTNIAEIAGRQHPPYYAQLMKNMQSLGIGNQEFAHILETMLITHTEILFYITYERARI